MKTETVYTMTGSYDPGIVDTIDSITVRLPLSTLLGIRRALRDTVKQYDAEGKHVLATDAEQLADQITDAYFDFLHAAERDA